MSSKNKQEALPEELTLKELILNIKDYSRFFLQKWYWFVLVGAIAAGLMAYKALKVNVVFSAPLTFSVEGGTTGGGGAGSILGQLGLGGSSEGNGSFKILELAKTRQVVEPVLFDSIVVDGEKDYLANHLIRQYGLHEEWEENTSLKGFLFSERPQYADRTANRVLKTLHSRVATTEPEKVLFTIVVDEFSGIFTMDARTVNDDLSYHLVDGMYRSLEKFYVESATRQDVLTLKLLNHRADSVETLLRSVESRLAVAEDRSARITLRKNTLNVQRLNREVLFLTTMYAEILKNKETASFLSNSEKPSFVIIDQPLYPLQAIRKSFVKSGVIGAIVGGLIVGVVLFFMKLVRDAIEENEDE